MTDNRSVSRHPTSATGPARPPLPGPYALPIAFTLLLALGALAAALHGGLGAAGVLVGAAAISGTVTALSEARSAPLVAGVAWLVVTGFSRAPYGTLHTDPHRAAVVALTVGGSSLAGAAAGAFGRGLSRIGGRPPLGVLDVPDGLRDDDLVSETAIPGLTLRDLAVAVSRRRQLAALAFGAVILPLLTVVLAALRPHLDLDDDLLLFLVIVLATTLIGGFWPAVAGAVAASLLLNWFFTPPIHNWTIDSPQNLFALLLFITVAVTVSSVVHLAARQATLARRSSLESATLLELARTVLGGSDTARDVVDHLCEREQVEAELQELVAGRWVRLAAGGTTTDPEDDAEFLVSPIRDDLRLLVSGHRSDDLSDRTLEGYGAQAAAALDRERLRAQAAQAEVLAAGNRMRTALLTAVSHDLRTPLASIKASVSSLRQTDVTWSAADRSELLATIEEGADRLDSLIANLLDMSRIQTGSLQPLLRPTSLEEIAPLALVGLDATHVELDLSDALPLVATDPGLLERAVANLVANAVRFSPDGRPPRLHAYGADGRVYLDVIDHGPGVPAAMKERIFEPFQQLGDQRSNNGVGLGLAVARGFIEATGGTLSAHDTAGGGLTMRLELNVAETAGSLPVAP